MPLHTKVSQSQIDNHSCLMLQLEDYCLSFDMNEIEEVCSAAEICSMVLSDLPFTERKYRLPKDSVHPSERLKTELMHL